MSVLSNLFLRLTLKPYSSPTGTRLKLQGFNVSLGSRDCFFSKHLVETDFKLHEKSKYTIYHHKSQYIESWKNGYPIFAQPHRPILAIFRKYSTAYSLNKLKYNRPPRYKAGSVITEMAADILHSNPPDYSILPSFLRIIYKQSMTLETTDIADRVYSRLIRNKWELGLNKHDREELYNVLLVIYAPIGRFDKILSIIDQMCQDDVEISHFTWYTVVEKIYELAPDKSHSKSSSLFNYFLQKFPYIDKNSDVYASLYLKCCAKPDQMNQAIRDHFVHLAQINCRPGMLICKTILSLSSKFELEPKIMFAAMLSYEWIVNEYSEYDINFICTNFSRNGAYQLKYEWNKYLRYRSSSLESGRSDWFQTQFHSEEEASSPLAEFVLHSIDQNTTLNLLRSLTVKFPTIITANSIQMEVLNGRLVVSDLEQEDVELFSKLLINYPRYTSIRQFFMACVAIGSFNLAADLYEACLSNLENVTLLETGKAYISMLRSVSGNSLSLNARMNAVDSIEKVVHILSAKSGNNIRTTLEKSIQKNIEIAELNVLRAKIKDLCVSALNP